MRTVKGSTGAVRGARQYLVGTWSSRALHAGHRGASLLPSRDKSAEDAFGAIPNW